MQMTGAEIFVRALTDLGVDIVFGYPGGAVLNIYDALFKNTKVRHLLCRHEQGTRHRGDPDAGFFSVSSVTWPDLDASRPSS